MISVALATLLLTAAPNNAAESREAYARCLKDFMRSSLEQKMEAAAFDTALAGACQDKQALFKTTMVNADVAMGMKRPASEKAIAEQIADYVAMAKEDYRAELAATAKTP